MANCEIQYINNNNEKFRLLTELLPIAVYSTDKDGLITYYNEQAVKLWGRRPKMNDPEELKFCGSWKIFDLNGNKLRHDECPMAQCLRDGKSRRNEEIVVIRPNYTKASVLVHIDPIYNEKNELEGAINVLFDISERKKIEEDTYHLASVVESSGDAIISKTLCGDITSWNKAAEAIFGYTSDEILGKSITILMPPERIKEEAFILEKIKKGEKIHQFETVRLKKNGKKINVALTVSPIKNSSGKIIGASKIARDISEKLEIQKKLKQYNRELRKLNSYKDAFISLASHELKTPITVVKAHLELLGDNAKEEDSIYIKKTLAHVDRLTHLVNKMFDVAKIEANKMNLDLTTFAIDDLVKDCINSVSIISGGSRIIYINDAPGIVIRADRQRIEQVIINLLNNAIKYSQAKEIIYLNVINNENDIEVQVKDKGMGIPANETGKIFNRFYRIEGRNNHIAGLGVGLYISRQIINKHNGKIWVSRSAPGKGSTFCFSIPKLPAEATSNNGFKLTDPIASLAGSKAE